MFYKLLIKNSKRNIKENAILFLSLIISIVGFYIILSIEDQGVIVFLRTMESNAVDQLLSIIPTLYIFTLVLLSFLIYFAQKYQLDRRSKEIGTYLMMGMKKSKLLYMLFLEDMLNSVITLIIGLPVAVFLSQMISLISTKLVGDEIIKVNLNISLDAIKFTIIGYITVRIIVLILLSIKLIKKEIVQMLSDVEDDKHKNNNSKKATIKLLVGIVLISVAYYYAIAGYIWQKNSTMCLIIVLGAISTFIIFSGLESLFEVKFKKNKSNLDTFTFRQLQENVFLKNKTLATTSLIIMISVASLTLGISTMLSSKLNEKPLTHYTFYTDNLEESKNIENEIRYSETEKFMKKVYTMEMNRLKSEYDNNTDFLNINKNIENIPQSKDKEMLLSDLETFLYYPYIIKESDYNELLELAQIQKIDIEEDEIYIYNSKEFTNEQKSKILKTALKDNTTIQIGNDEFKVSDKIQNESLVTDRSITIAYALIVDDSFVEKYTDEKNRSYYTNATIKDEFIEENGLMNMIMMVNNIIDTKNIEYESYLQNIGRSLFYKVSYSYIFTYVGIMFFIISNTVMGVQYLMNQKKTTNRYKILLKLGANYDKLSKSSSTQIKYYFSLPTIIGTISGLMAIISVVKNKIIIISNSNIVLYIMFTLVILFMIEYVYIKIVINISNQNIKSMMDIKRENI